MLTCPRTGPKAASLRLNTIHTSQIRDLPEKKPIRSAEVLRESMHSGIIPQLGITVWGVSSVGRASDF